MALDNTLKRFSDAKQAIIDSLNNKGVITDNDIGFEDFSSKIDEIESSIQEEEIITQDSGWNYIVLEDGTIQLTLYTGDSTDIVVPNRYIDNGVCYKVSKVGNPNVKLIWDATYELYKPDTSYNVFSNDVASSSNTNKTITYIEVAEGVEVGDCAFRRCEALTKLKLHKNIKRIGICALANCSSLTGHLILPEGLTYIDANAFNNTFITELTLPESLCGYGYKPFGGDACKITKIHFNCNNLDNYYQHSNIGYITNPFGALLESIDFNSSIKFLPQACFYNKNNLNLDNILKDLYNLQNIPSYAFYENKDLANISIPESVKTIDFCAFGSCKGLTSITIPNSVTSICAGAFYDCTSLTDIWYGGTEADKAKISIESDNAHLLNATWHYVQPISDDTYTYLIIDGEVIITNVNPELEGPVEIPSTLGGYPVTGINSYSFKDCINVTSIVIPDTITHIGIKAFAGCSKLTNITIPDSVKALGYTHFENYV